MAEVATNTFLYGFYHNFEEFRGKYYKEYDKTRFVNADVRNIAKSIPAAHHEAMERLAIYRDLLANHIMGGGKIGALFLMQIANRELR
ncbi:hypothetical protein EJ08DRAFT_696144 [Tothia fuscella]|uniref:Uncharacterized protein n=1 Tax=Tothia fuscella TaxID=1048955 RepID=A0A9P4U086_9PEZI|nr:hypothetical protein EJ08DRAFT_696144 [Tothia fuscella]